MSDGICARKKVRAASTHMLSAKTLSVLCNQKRRWQANLYILFCVDTEGWKITILLTRNWQELLQKRLKKGGLEGGVDGECLFHLKGFQLFKDWAHWTLRIQVINGKIRTEDPNTHSCPLSSKMFIKFGSGVDATQFWR
jgi:hypothetical protein